MLKTLLIPRIFLAALYLPAVACAAPNEVLFIGNSFTMEGTAGVPMIFDRLAIAGGQEDPNTVMRAVGGTNFLFHETDATSQAQIAARPWTHVVLQNHSTEPTHIGSVANHLTYGGLLDQRILANNPATKVVLFETWSRAANHALITTSTFASTAEMQSELRKNYADLAAQLNTNRTAAPVVIAPVGDAWENAGGLLAESHPYFADLHATDRYHGNDNGYYLAAAVIYAQIYQSSPEGLGRNSAVTSLNLNLTIDSAALERFAWDTVTGNTGVRFTSHPQSVTVPTSQDATFTATVRGAVPYQFQWFRNGEEIPGATGLTLTVPNVTSAMDGDVFNLRATNPTASPVSESATLTIIPDTMPPVLSTPVLNDPLTITLPFNEALSLSSATAGNFTVVHRGSIIPVTAAALSPDGRGIVLTLGSAITTGFTVSVNGAVGDASGNLITGGTIGISNAPASGMKSIFIDFGAADQTTTADPGRTWNNVTPTIGTSNTARLNPLVGNDGIATGTRLEMISRFNGANTSGSTTATVFPASVTRDTLYGNSETFNGLTNVFPAFRLAGLDPSTKYSLTFYASRTATDNRTTIYTVTGGAVSSTKLNASDNLDTTAVLTGLSPGADGRLTVEISPAPENNSTNHFTYLGALVISSETKTTMHAPVMLADHLIVDWQGSGQLESSPDLQSPWTPVTPAPAPPFAAPKNGPAHFYRLRYETP